MSRNLILIPCCKEKDIADTTQEFDEPLEGLACHRQNLLKIIAGDNILSEKLENECGILNENATLTRAVDLYQGTFYRTAGNELQGLVNEGKSSCIHILIVSAFYGLVKLGEGLKTYELQMGESLQGTVNNINRPDKFWKSNKLWGILKKYIEDNEIERVWSLLPNSLSNKCKTPYHRVFNELWKNARNNGQPECRRVLCFRKKENQNLVSIGSGSGEYRAKWLKKMLSNGHSLCNNNLPPVEFDSIDAVYEYKGC